MRYFIFISYRGTSYNGWQRQSGAPSVQQTLEEALGTLLRHAVDVTGAGRTDSGVHASHYAAHFDTDFPVDAADDFCYHLNAILPGDIAVREIVRVRDDAHARFDAMRREYRYRILPFKDPFRRDVTWQYYVPLDIDRMNAAAALLPAHDDFTTFSKLHSGNKTNICRVYKSLWAMDGDEVVYTVAADRFLRNMVRSLVGTMVDVGRGKMSVEQFGQALRSLDRSKASGSAPARGLFFEGACYPADIYSLKVSDK